MLIKITTHFAKQYRKLSLSVKEKAKEKEKMFRQNPFAAEFKTHKLQGKDKECWAFWITRACRIKFIFISSDEVLFLSVGGYEIYK